MTAPDVCAVIVTYHPSAAMLENLPDVRKQVQRLVVVDNGSTSSELKALRLACGQVGAQLIENGENLGVAEALNRGVRWANSEGSPWVILFDQDSRITDGFVRNMFATWEAHPERDRLASVHPTYVDPDSGLEPQVRRAKDGSPIMYSTSGALMPTWSFDKIGEFATDYFIDCVDFEYSLRTRAAGYLIADSQHAVLLHAAGRPDREVRLLGLRFRPTHHSEIRRYYMSRNRIAVCRKYFFVFPGWTLQFMWDCLRETVKCFLGEHDRMRKFHYFVLGTWDGLTGKMGKRREK